VVAAGSLASLDMLVFFIRLSSFAVFELSVTGPGRTTGPDAETDRHGPDLSLRLWLLTRFKLIFCKVHNFHGESCDVEYVSGKEVAKK